MLCPISSLHHPSSSPRSQLSVKATATLPTFRMEIVFAIQFGKDGLLMVAQHMMSQKIRMIQSFTPLATSVSLHLMSPSRVLPVVSLAFSPVTPLDPHGASLTAVSAAKMQRPISTAQRLSFQHVSLALVVPYASDAHQVDSDVSELLKCRSGCVESCISALLITSDRC